MISGFNIPKNIRNCKTPNFFHLYAFYVQKTCKWGKFFHIFTRLRYPYELKRVKFGFSIPKIYIETVKNPIMYFISVLCTENVKIGYILHFFQIFAMLLIPYGWTMLILKFCTSMNMKNAWEAELCLLCAKNGKKG